jgi:hypothetical protein
MYTRELSSNMILRNADLAWIPLDERNKDFEVIYSAMVNSGLDLSTLPLSFDIDESNHIV